MESKKTKNKKANKENFKKPIHGIKEWIMVARGDGGGGVGKMGEWVQLYSVMDGFFTEIEKQS